MKAENIEMLDRAMQEPKNPPHLPREAMNKFDRTVLRFLLAAKAAMTAALPIRVAAATIPPTAATPALPERIVSSSGTLVSFIEDSFMAFAFNCYGNSTCPAGPLMLIHFHPISVRTLFLIGPGLYMPSQ